MTDKQKLQQLFEAALKAPAPHNEGIAPQRAFPTPNLDFAPIAQPEPAPAAPAAPVVAAPQAQSVFETVEEIPAPAPTLDKEEAEKLGTLLDEKIATKSRRRKIELVVTLVLFFGSTIGTTAWFVQSQSHMQATKEAMRDIRQYGDIQSTVAKYQEHLNKVGTRNQQLDQASSTMGADPKKVDHADEAMDAEMQQVMGDEGGKTHGERNKAMQTAFGDRAKQARGPLKTDVALKEGKSFH